MVTTVRRRVTPRPTRAAPRTPVSPKRLAGVCPSTTFKWAPYGTVGVWHDNCYDYAFDMNNPRSKNKDQMGNMSGTPPKLNGYSTCDGIAKRVLSDYKGLAYKLPRADSPVKPGYYKVMNFVAPVAGDFHWYKQIFRVVYKTRSPGNNPLIGRRGYPDTVQGLAKFFQVPESVIRAAYAKSKRATSNNNGRITMNNSNLRRLNTLNEVPDPDGKLKPGRVMVIPVRLWAHKQGFGGGPVIVDASGKTIRDPRRANRNYGGGLNYSRFCSAYAVKCGAGRIALARARKARTAL